MNAALRFAVLVALSMAETQCGGAGGERPVDLRYAPAQLVYSNGRRGCDRPAPDGLCPPVVMNDSMWDRCPFPREADVAKVDDARAVVQVAVSATGSAEGVQILVDPGYGFGRVAAICALVQAYLPAHYPDGRTVAGSIKMAVHFSRSSD